MMKLFLVERDDEVWPDQYDSSVVIAETEESAVEMIKEKYDRFPYWSYWGDYEVTVTEITFDEPKIILGSFRRGNYE
jgi:hypothetical protein